MKSTATYTKKMYLNIEKKWGMGCVADYISGVCKCLKVLSMYEKKSL